jgi:CelD/BcsL family acetyltransferase involved in cellulose biosynthesis
MQSVTELPASGAAAPSWLTPPKSQSADDLAVEVVSDTAGLDPLAAEWLALEQRSGANTVFQSFRHIRFWARHFLVEQRGSRRLHVAVVREHGRAVLILPLVLSRRAPLNVGRLAGDPVAQYADLIVDPAAAARQHLDAALRSVRQAGADAIVFRRVRRDSHLHRLAGELFASPTGESTAPWVDLAPYRDYEAFLQTLSKKMRHGLRNRRNHLDKAGAFAFELLPGGAEARAALADAIDMKRRWLIQRGAISSAFTNSATRNCLLDIAGDESGTGAVVARLLVNGVPAAIRFGFEYQGTHFCYMSAYDRAFANLSPGKLLMNDYVSRFRERGLQRIDMLPPGGQHKADWCRLESGVADYTLPLTALGRAYASGYQERLRPALQRIWQDLPDGIRSLVATWFVSI